MMFVVGAIANAKCASYARCRYRYSVKCDNGVPEQYHLARINLRDCQKTPRHAAVLILLIYRNEVYGEDSLDKGVAEISIGKQRNGPIGTVHLAFLGQYRRFANLAQPGSY